MREAAQKDTISSSTFTPDETQRYLAAMEKFISVSQELSHARTLEEVIKIIRIAARELTGADGASFVLKDGDQCYYVDENAVGPLWKGMRFPLSTCISGWVMNNRQAAAIEDIYVDPRIPHEAYRPTFVKSLVMVPVRKNSPIAAIGNYWAHKHRASEFDINLLQALADTASVAMENVFLYNDLQNKIRALQESNKELSHFASVTSHDLQEPLRTIRTQLDIFERKHRSKLDEIAVEHLHAISSNAGRLQNLVKDLLVHASISRSSQLEAIDSNQILQDVLEHDLATSINNVGARISCGDMPWVWGNATALSRIFQNLIFNSLKFRKKDVPVEIKISCVRDVGVFKFSVEDNGIGIEPEYHKKIFELFQRQHSRDEYAGSGIGLATCKKVMEMHAGRIWVESELGKGSTFYFTLSPASEIREAENAKS